MKKVLLVFSFIVPLLFSGTSIVKSKAVDLIRENNDCGNPSDSIVRVINNYDVFSSNGFVYKNDDKYTYIVTSSNVVNNTNNYKILYSNGMAKKALILGYDKNNEVAVLRTNKEEINPVCIANSDYIYKGQKNYAYGYYDVNKEFFIKTNFSQIGNLYHKNGQMGIYKSLIDIDGSKVYKGTGVFDELNRLVGVITGFQDGFSGASFITESNRVLKIADSIVKTGKYNVNYIKYNLEDYSAMSLAIKQSYGVSNKANYGVVITTFKPLSYLFGGLNQGMVIVAVNGVKVKNKYELDKQLARYQKNDNVCLKVIKKNGKVAFYHTDI
jgi:S1-C subfamily serine protease